MRKIWIVPACVMVLLSGCAAENEYLLAESVWDDGDGSPQRVTYEYDEAGRCKSQTCEDDDLYGMGQFYERIEYSYDDHGSLLRETVCDETSTCHVLEYGNTYDESGRLIRTEYTYDSHGRLIKSACYTDSQTLDSYREYTYESITETVIQYEPDGTRIAKEVRIYDDAGNLIKEQYYGTDGEIWQTVTHCCIKC